MLQLDDPPSAELLLGDLGQSGFPVAGLGFGTSGFRVRGLRTRWPSDSLDRFRHLSFLSLRTQSVEYWTGVEGVAGFGYQGFGTLPLNA